MLKLVSLHPYQWRGKNTDNNLYERSIVDPVVVHNSIAHRLKSITVRQMQTDVLMKCFDLPPGWTRREVEWRKPSNVKLYPPHPVYAQTLSYKFEDGIKIGSVAHYVWTLPFEQWGSLGSGYQKKVLASVSDMRWPKGFDHVRQKRAAELWAAELCNCLEPTLERKTIYLPLRTCR